MTGKIEIISPTNEQYDKISESLQATKRRKFATTSLYNSIAEAYNRCDIDGFLIAPELNEKRVANLEKVFSNRGVTRYQDYDIYRPSIDADGKPIEKEKRRTLLKRLSATLMRVV